jgi:hypothetical protein
MFPRRHHAPNADIPKVKYRVAKTAVFSLIPLLFLLTLAEVFFRLYPSGDDSAKMAIDYDLNRPGIAGDSIS